MRSFINIVEGEHTPPAFEPGDAVHQDALEQTGFWGEQAAGCLVQARSTGRILLVLRSGEVEEPHTWGNVGGAHTEEEQPREAALREFYEETGYHGDVEMLPMMVFRSGDFRYSNFLAVIDDEFEPDLGWEADAFRWCQWGEWPSPLHFGCEAVFADQRSAALMSKLVHQN